MGCGFLFRWFQLQFILKISFRAFISVLSFGSSLNCLKSWKNRKTFLGDIAWVSCIFWVQLHMLADAECLHDNSAVCIYICRQTIVLSIVRINVFIVIIVVFQSLPEFSKNKHRIRCIVRKRCTQCPCVASERTMFRTNKNRKKLSLLVIQWMCYT